MRILPLLAAALVPSLPALAENAPEPAVETIVGEVVDTTCYLMHEGMGPEHKKCAVTCTKAGSPAAILDEQSGTLYYALRSSDKSHHGKQRPDEPLLPFVGDRVKVKGTVYKRAGAKAITLDSVEKAPAPAPAKK